MDAKKIQEEVSKLRAKFTTLETDTKLEIRDTHIAAEILLRLLEEQAVSKEQITFLKEQSVDFGKVLTLIGLQAVPGSSIAIIVLEKIGEKHGFSIFPYPNKVIPNMK
jgi:hypothetical protein